MIQQKGNGSIIRVMAISNACPACGKPIAIDDINMREGVGLCRSCGKLSRLAEIADAPAVDADALAAPPAGCSYEEPMEGGLIVRASLRSVGTAAALLAFALFWNGITSVFVLEAISELYRHFIGPVPAWFPAPNVGKKASKGLGEILFLCVFLIPFVSIGLGMIIGCLIAIFGRVELAVNGTDAVVRTGIGPFCWPRRFDASKVKRVSQGQSQIQTEGRPKKLIEIEADRTIKFGSGLPDERRTWMTGILHMLLVAPTNEARARLGLSRRARG